ncbi:MAG: hypothetical protein QOE61_3458, partial [Micromonosporaceae bacterium]|nr:hypothetical protein [Micromonosporaceae bacterium]
MRDHHNLTQVFRVPQPLLLGLPSDPVDDGCEFGCLVAGDYLKPTRRQLPPDRRGRAEACILPGLAQHLDLYRLRDAERPQYADKEAFLVNGEEVQAGPGVDDRPLA